MIKVLLRRTAQKDILDAARFYEKQEHGLGHKVAVFLDGKIQELARTAGVHPFQHGFHRAVVDGAFPYYVIYYTLETGIVHVRAVFDHRRDPEKLRRQLRRR